MKQLQALQEKPSTEKETTLRESLATQENPRSEKETPSRSPGLCRRISQWRRSLS